MYCTFMHQETADWLMSIGITCRKSLTLDLKIDITKDFLRGYYDGNGTAVKHAKNSAGVQISTGSKSFSDLLTKFLISNNVNWKVIETKPGLYKYKGELRPTQPHYKGYVSSKPEALKFYNLIYYEPGLTCIARKHKTFAERLGKEIV